MLFRLLHFTLNFMNRVLLSLACLRLLFCVRCSCSFNYFFKCYFFFCCFFLIFFFNFFFFFGGCFLIGAYLGRISYSRVLVMLLLSSLNFPLIKLSVY